MICESKRNEGIKQNQMDTKFAYHIVRLLDECEQILMEGDIDLQNELDGEVFKPLKDAAYFKRLEVHPELHTLTWPNGADFAPEFLYEKIKMPA